ncbi:hypothetical protein ACHQM5_005166 [Ranunculus cassubicifolius]
MQIPNNGNSSNNHTIRSPPPPPPSSLSLGLISIPPPPRPATHLISDHRHRHHHHHPHVIEPQPISTAHPESSSTTGAATAAAIGRVRLSDIVTYDGAPVGNYVRSVEALSGSLMRHNAVVIELGSEDSGIMRCALEGARMYFRMRGGQSSGNGGGGIWGKPSRGVYMYRAGRALEDGDSSPPCMADAYKCMGKAARAALCAIARHLRLRSDVFNHLLDDTPLPANEASSSVLVAAYSHSSLQNGKGSIGGWKLSMNSEVEKGLVTLIASDSPGLQVCDPNSRWYIADGGSCPGDLLLLTGKALSHATAGLRPAASYRSTAEYSTGTSGRTSLAFRLMPQGNAILDCSPIAAAGHVIPHSYVPVSVSQFMDDLSAEEDMACIRPDSTSEPKSNLNQEPSLRSILSDPLSGVFLEDAMVVSCGHSFGGLMLRKVIETSRCSICNLEIESGSLVPNLALRAAAAAVKHEDGRRLFHNAALRKRRKEMGEHMFTMKRLNRENGEISIESDNSMHNRGVQYPFSVNEKVLIKGNRRTPEKFVGSEAVITSQCLNGWYLLKILGSGESVRLQYRSLRKILSSQVTEDRAAPQQTIVQNGS